MFCFEHNVQMFIRFAANFVVHCYSKKLILINCLYVHSLYLDPYLSVCFVVYKYHDFLFYFSLTKFWIDLFQKLLWVLTSTQNICLLQITQIVIYPTLIVYIKQADGVEAYNKYSLRKLKGSNKGEALQNKTGSTQNTKIQGPWHAYIVDVHDE